VVSALGVPISRQRTTPRHSRRQTLLSITPPAFRTANPRHSTGVTPSLNRGFHVPENDPRTPNRQAQSVSGLVENGTDEFSDACSFSVNVTIRFTASASNSAVAFTAGVCNALPHDHANYFPQVHGKPTLCGTRLSLRPMGFLELYLHSSLFHTALQRTSSAGSKCLVAAPTDTQFSLRP
jgi:hypothetical protein